MKKKIIIIVVVVLLLIGAVVVIKNKKASIAKTPAVAAYPLPVEVAEAREGSILMIFPLSRDRSALSVCRGGAEDNREYSLRDGQGRRYGP